MGTIAGLLGVLLAFSSMIFSVYLFIPKNKDKNKK
jgi:hypothetical protein